MKYCVTILLLLLSCLSTFAQQDNDAIGEGNRLYRQQQYEKAEAEYRSILVYKPADQSAKFNLASSLAKQKKIDEANKFFSELNGIERKPVFRAKVIYDQGVLLTQQKKLEESIEFYKESLRLNPEDNDARENLQKALMELKKKTPPKKDEKKKEEQQKQQPKPKLNQKQAQQQLKLLEQKEKQVQERLQKNSSRTGNSMPKDW